jgi:hypothetical protein
MFLRQVLSPNWGKRNSLSPSRKVVPASWQSSNIQWYQLWRLSSVNDDLKEAQWRIDY